MNIKEIPRHRPDLMRFWIDDPILHDFAVKEVGIDEFIEETDLEDFFFYLTVWIQGRLDDDFIHEMQTGSKGAFRVLEFLVSRLPDFGFSQNSPSPQPSFQCPF